MTLEELDRLFEDPANRPLGVFYHCPADPRVLAPSRPGAGGWQINWAHPRAFALCSFYLGLLLGPIALVGVLGPADPFSRVLLITGVFGLSVTALIILSVRLSRRHHA